MFSLLFEQMSIKLPVIFPIKTSYAQMLIVVKICLMFLDFLNRRFSSFLSFLSFYSFLVVSKGSDLSRKMREAISCNLAPVRSKSDVMEPSYDQKTVLKKT